MDIRKHDTDTIRFADIDAGTAKATYLTKAASGYKICSEDRKYLLIYQKDLDAFKKAIAFAEEMWMRK